MCERTVSGAPGVKIGSWHLDLTIPAPALEGSFGQSVELAVGGWQFAAEAREDLS